MTGRPGIDPLLVDLDLRCSAAHAFATWTDRFGLWWPPGHTTSGPDATVHLEPRLGGRIFERTNDGREIDWGEVTDWDPPRRLVRAAPAPQDRSRTGRMIHMADGQGTAEDPWALKTPRGTSDYQMYREPDADPPTLVCVVGKTALKYHLRAIDDLHAMLVERGDWVELGAADEQKPAKDRTVEAWGRDDSNPVGGWYGRRCGRCRDSVRVGQRPLRRPQVGVPAATTWLGTSAQLTALRVRRPGPCRAGRRSRRTRTCPGAPRRSASVRAGGR